MIDSGYTHATAKNPNKNLLIQPGFKELAEQYLPDTFLLDALREDISSKPGKRDKELALAFKVKGRLIPADERQVINNTQVNVNTPHGEQMVEDFMQYMLKQTLSENREDAT